MSQIKFVYFDIGDVVFSWQEVLKKIAVMSNKPLERVWAVFDKYDLDVCRGKIMPQAFWVHFKEELGIKEDIENFVEWWTSDFTPIPLMHQLVQETSKKYRLGILTNIYPEVWKYYIRGGLIPDVTYDVIVKSCDIGLAKPEKEIYEYAQKKAKVLPQEILFIDNSKENIEAAKKLGWQVVWYDVNKPEKSVAEVKQVLNLN